MGGQVCCTHYCAEFVVSGFLLSVFCQGGGGSCPICCTGSVLRLACVLWGGMSRSEWWYLWRLANQINNKLTVKPSIIFETIVRETCSPAITLYVEYYYCCVWPTFAPLYQCLWQHFILYCTYIDGWSFFLMQQIIFQLSVLHGEQFQKKLHLWKARDGDKILESV